MRYEIDGDEGQSLQKTLLTIIRIKSSGMGYLVACATWATHQHDRLFIMYLIQTILHVIGVILQVIDQRESDSYDI